MAQLGAETGWEQAVTDPDQMPTRKSIAAIRTRLANVEAKRQALFQQGNEMIAAFKAKYPDSPATLVRYADRTLNDYRWRLSGSAKWRHTGQPGNKVAVELTGEVGQKILSSLPPPTRVDWLYFETRRQALNFASAMTKYEIMRLRQLIERQELLRQLVRQGGNPT